MITARKLKVVHGGVTTSATQAAVRGRFGVSLRNLEAWEILNASGVPELLDMVEAGRLNKWSALELCRLPSAAQLECISLGASAARSIARELSNLRVRGLTETCASCGGPIGPKGKALRVGKTDLQNDDRDDVLVIRWRWLVRLVRAVR